jgi:hypothetical protein
LLKISFLLMVVSWPHFYCFANFCFKIFNIPAKAQEESHRPKIMIYLSEIVIPRLIKITINRAVKQ